jgi:hypothetical protein
MLLKVIGGPGAYLGLGDNLFGPIYRDDFLNRVRLSDLVEGSDHAALAAEGAGFQVARCGAIYRADVVVASVLDDAERPCTRSCLRFGHDARARDAVRLCRCSNTQLCQQKDRHQGADTRGAHFAERHRRAGWVLRDHSIIGRGVAPVRLPSDNSAPHTDDRLRL